MCHDIIKKRTESNEIDLKNYVIALVPTLTPLTSVYFTGANIVYGWGENLWEPR